MDKKKKKIKLIDSRVIKCIFPKLTQLNWIDNIAVDTFLWYICKLCWTLVFIIVPTFYKTNLLPNRFFNTNAIANDRVNLMWKRLTV